VLLVAPFALFLLLGTWFLQIVRHVAKHKREHPAERAQASASHARIVEVFAYVLRHTRKSQFLLLGAALTALPLLYAGLELPKLIINNAISSRHFPFEILGIPLSQTNYLFLLCSLYLVVILINGSLKYAINVRKGRVAEALLRRLRLTIFRYWRRDAGKGDRAQVIPMLVQEVEPIGGFAGDAFVLPLFQGGTFLTILAFMFVQDPVLGAAAVTLLPMQLALVPRLQRKINSLSRRRAHEMRSLGGAIGREIGTDSVAVGETRRQVADALRRVADVRFEIYRKKFFMKGLNNFITQLTPFFFYTVGGYLVIEDRLSFGALVAVLAAHKDFSAPLKELLKYYQTMEDVRVRFSEIQRFLLAQTAKVNPYGIAAVSSREPAQACAPDPMPSSMRGRLPTTERGNRLQPCAPQIY
jgi:ABC-type multidrug transport system fused ATPase/permease subunit